MITLDGTSGITTPGLINTGSETIVNLTTSGNTILGDASTDTLNVGNGGLVKDASGNVGIGVTPSTISAGKIVEVGYKGNTFWGNSASAIYITANAYYNGGWTYGSTNAAGNYQINAGVHAWSTAPSGTAGNAITFTQAMTLDASGNLGVGTTSPTRSRFVSQDGTDNTTADPAGLVGSFVAPTPSGQGSSISLESNSAIAADTGGVLGFGGRYSGTAYANWASIKGLKDNATSAEYGGYLSFYTRTMGANSAERMRIDSSGNVGIGTTSPSTKLHVSSSTTNVTLKLSNSTTGSGVGDGLDFIVDNTDTYIFQRENGPLLFGTNNAERMRIDASGNLLVGTTSNADGVKGNFLVPTNNNAIRAASSVATNAMYCGYFEFVGRAPNDTGSQFVTCNDNAATRFVIRGNGGIANYSANNVNLSDRREKTNFAPASDYLDKICAIPVQTFNYIDQNLEEDAGLTLGVVAQDVQAVCPEMVMESNWAGKDEEEKIRLSVYQTDLQYALMKCIQELKAELDITKAKVAALEAA